ncbi:IS66 family insertion sequence element accessory protein TnpB [Mesorhizobium sp. M0808]|uniref:IS66 family insertion sequence element accessory protein TnpB n=1 Tax=Mesorhizobium sp. M0808 TaxID=2957002 RepID=UPI00333A6A23
MEVVEAQPPPISRPRKKSSTVTIELGGARRLRIESISIPKRSAGSWMCWSGDDPGPERREGVAPHWLYTDMRKGFPGLALMVQETLKRDPHSGHLFCFRGRRGGLIKVIWHDGQGACLFTKKLEGGRFIWPSAADGTVVITPAQLGYLLEGIDWWMPQKTWRPSSAG